MNSLKNNTLIFILISIIICLGCEPTQKRQVVPQISSSIYFIPDWQNRNAERRELLGSTDIADAVMVFFAMPEKQYTAQDIIVIPKQSEVIRIPFATLFFLKLSPGSTAIPYGIAKKEADIRPFIIVIKGEASQKMLTKIKKSFSPDLYIFISDHYEKMKDIHGKSAHRTGCGDFELPFLGDFPHILKISVRNSKANARPVDAQGYLLKATVSTFSQRNKIESLKSLFQLTVEIEEWIIGKAEITRTIDITNPFQYPLDLSVAQAEVENCLWDLSIRPDKILLNPGDTTSLSLHLTLENRADHDPGPLLHLQMTVNNTKSFNENIPVKVIFLPQLRKN